MLSVCETLLFFLLHSWKSGCHSALGKTNKLNHRAALAAQTLCAELIATDEQAHECGPRRNKDGPCLLRLTGVTVAPAEFLAWFQGSFLKRYVTRVYWIDPALPVADTKARLPLPKQGGAHNNDL